MPTRSAKSTLCMSCFAQQRVGALCLSPAKLDLASLGKCRGNSVCEPVHALSASDASQDRQIVWPRLHVNSIITTCREFQALRTRRRECLYHWNPGLEQVMRSLIMITPSHLESVVQDYSCQSKTEHQPKVE